MTTGFSTDDARILNEESARALSSILAKAAAAEPDRHRDFVLSSCAVALRYLEQIHIFGTSGYSPIALSLSRSFFEIVCGTIYLAENKSELEDFVSFGPLTQFEMLERQGAPVNY